MDEQVAFKKEMRRTGTALFIYTVGGFLIILPLMFFLLLCKFSETDTTWIANCLGMLLLSLIFIRFYSKHLQVHIPLRMKDTSSKMADILTWGIISLGVFWGASLIFSLLSSPFSNIVTFNTPDFTPTGSLFTKVLSVGYAAIGAPILEEYIFRGLFFHKLKPYGKLFAAIVVSIIFALSHANLPQTIPTFFLSLGLCTLVDKSDSILPAIIVHIIANSIGSLATIFEGPTFIYIMNLLLLAVMVMAFTLLCVYLSSYRFAKNKDQPHHVYQFFCNWGSILFLVYTIVNLIMMIQLH